MTNISIQPLWLTHFIEILLVTKFQLTKFIIGAFSYKAHLDPKFPLMLANTTRFNIVLAYNKLSKTFSIITLPSK